MVGDLDPSNSERMRFTHSSLCKKSPLNIRMTNTYEENRKLLLKLKEKLQNLKSSKSLDVKFQCFLFDLNPLFISLYMT